MPALPPRAHPADPHSPARAAAAGAALAVCGAGAVAAAGLGAGLPSLTAPGGAGVDEVALLAAGVLALGLLLRWVVGALLLAGSAVVAATGRRWSAGERAAQRALPRGVHALLVTGLSAGALGAGPAALAAPAPALASAPLAAAAPTTHGVAPDGAAGDGRPAAPTGLDPGWTPTEPEAPACADPQPPVLGTPTRTTADLPDVVVRRGDTLWAVAARDLPVDATDAEIAVEWPRWYRANREAIGPDPDRLLVGLRLRAPQPGS